MTGSLFDHLEAARRAYFVGRSQERDLLREAINKEELPLGLIYIFGPGVGKSSLLRESAYWARQANVRVLPLDGRNLEVSPAGFLHALQQLLGLSHPEAVIPELMAYDGRLLLQIDTAELLFPLDSWLQETFLPQLPGHVLVIMAGRNPPSLRWRTDPGWQQLMRLVPLKNLSQEEGRAFLMRRAIPARQHERILAFTYGHPLALSLIADMFAQHPDIEFHPENAPDIIKSLLEQFMQEVPSPLHRAALEACSQVRLLNEPLLGALLDVKEPHAIFAWLRGLSFMEAERRGLYPHDLAREALAVDLRWRDPLWQVELHNRARTFYIQRFHESSEQQQRHILSDYIFLHRDNPVIQAYFDWQATGTVFTDSYLDSDQATLLAMIRQHEGETAATLATHWLERQPEGWVIFRQPGGMAQGLLLQLALEKCTAEDAARDPAVAAALNFLANHAPLRLGDAATLFRFWMVAETYQGLSPVQSRIFLNMVQHYLTRTNLAFTFIPCAEPDSWVAVFGFAEQDRLSRADFLVDDRSFGMYGHDWRVVPPLVWLARMAEHELGIKVDLPEPAGQLAARPDDALDEAAFTAAVQEALRHFTDDLALQNNPLCRSRLVDKTAVDVTPVGQLRQLVQEGLQQMTAHPKQNRWQRALHHTYIQPAATQEQAAELLDLPFSTYRRYLRLGVQYLTDWLWARSGRSNFKR